MWLVIKYKTNEIETLKKSLTNIIGETPEFYHPKIKLKKIINGKMREHKKDVLDKYIFCRHKKFSDISITSLISNAKGSKYLLNGYKQNQNSINRFVDFCKQHQNDDGFLKQSFFNNLIKTKIQFLSGPFSQLIFDIIEDKKKEIKILGNKIKLTISKDQNNLLFNYV